MGDGDPDPPGWQASSDGTRSGGIRRSMRRPTLCSYVSMKSGEPPLAPEGDVRFEIQA